MIMSDNEADDKAIDFLMESAEKLGVSCATTKDGHVLVFKKDFLKNLLEKNIDRDTIAIFIKRNDFKN